MPELPVRTPPDRRDSEWKTSDVGRQVTGSVPHYSTTIEGDEDVRRENKTGLSGRNISRL